MSSPRRSPAVPYVFPHSHNHKVYVTHIWVTLNYWLCGGGKGFSRRCGFIIAALMIGSVLLGASAFPGSRQSDADKGGLGDVAPQTDSDKKFTDPEDQFLNLDGIFTDDNHSKDHESEWDMNRQYGIVIDAGSSGSRLLVYSWIDPKKSKLLGQSGIITIDKGAQTGSEWIHSIEPGISSLASQPSYDNVDTYLKPLLEFAAAAVPKAKIPSTPLYLFATAGMRLISESAQGSILINACESTQQYGFSLVRGCNSHFRVISGRLEGIFGWLTVNYLKGGFGKQESAPPTDMATFGFLDMGGASTQIAFEPDKKAMEDHPSDLTSVKLRTVAGIGLKFNVFSTTFLGFGVNEARKRYMQSLLQPNAETHIENHLRLRQENKEIVNTNAKNAPSSVSDPCLPSGLLLENTLEDKSAATHFLGTGSLSGCLSLQLPLLNKSSPCTTSPCFFNGVHGPPATFKESRPYLGASEYFYTPHSVYDLPEGPLDPAAFEKETSSYCATPWTDLLQKFESKVWPHADIKRVQMQCFKSAWLLTILHEGFGAPKNMTTVEPVNEINGFSVSWTLGAMVIHVSGTIPPDALAGTPNQHQPIPMDKPTFWSLHGRVIIVMLCGIAFIFMGIYVAGTMWARWQRRRRRGSKPILFTPIPSKSSGSDYDDDAEESSFSSSPRAARPFFYGGKNAVDISLNDLEAGTSRKSLLPRIASGRNISGMVSSANTP
ncbi:Golgi apyrase [Phlyctochytrium planicorne]|nr:Golgi apyrase [Phlyctochytrium planicorne]